LDDLLKSDNKLEVRKVERIQPQRMAMQSSMQKSNEKNEDLLELEKEPEIESNMTDLNELAKQMETEVQREERQIMRMASMTSMPAKDKKKKKKLFGKK
jgi:hypothetical protein